MTQCKHSDFCAYQNTYICTSRYKTTTEKQTSYTVTADCHCITGYHYITCIFEFKLFLNHVKYVQLEVTSHT